MSASLFVVVVLAASLLSPSAAGSACWSAVVATRCLGRDGTVAKLNSRCKRRVADLNLLSTSFDPATFQPFVLFLARLSRSRRRNPFIADLENLGFDERPRPLQPVVCVPHNGAVHLNMALRAKGQHIARRQVAQWEHLDETRLWLLRHQSYLLNLEITR